MINMKNCERWLLDFVTIILKSFKKLHMIENIENIQNKAISKKNRSKINNSSCTSKSR